MGHSPHNCTPTSAWSGYNRVTIGPVSRSSVPNDDFATIQRGAVIFRSTNGHSSAG